MKGKKSKRHILDRVIEGLLYASVILVPLIFLRCINDSFNLPKMSLSQLFIFTMFLLWLVRMNLRREYRISQSPIYLPLFIFLGIEVLSIIWAKNVLLSVKFIVQDVAFGLLVVIGINTVRTEKLFRRILLATVCTAFIVAILGILQYFKLDVLSLFPGGEGMIFSTIGHYNLLASYVVIVVPSSLIMILVSKTPKKRFFFGFVSSVLLFALLITKSRGAWLGWMAALFVLLYGFIYLRKGNRKIQWRKFVPSLVVKGIIVLLVFVIGIHIASQIYVGRDGYTLQHWMKHFVDSTTQRAVSTFYIGTGSAMHRRMIWIPTLHMIKDNPFTGVGKNNFQIMYPKYTPDAYKEGLNFLKRRGVRTHNEYLQIFSELGIFGFLALLWILFVVLKTALHSLRRYRLKDEGRYLVRLGVLAGILSVLVHSLVTNPLRFPTSAMHFWLFAGLTMGMYSLDEGCRPFTRKFLGRTTLVEGLYKIAIGLLVILIMLTPLLIIRPLVADYYVKKGDVYRHREQFAEAISSYGKAFSYGCRDSNVYRVLGSLYFFTKKYDSAIEQWHRDLSVSPHFPQTYHLLGSAYFMKDELALSERMLLRALEIYPKYDKVREALEKLYLHWGAVLWERGLIEEALATYHRALQILGNNQEIHLRLGHIHYHRGNAERAVQEYEAAIEVQPDFAPAYKALGEVYSNSSEPWRAVGYYQRYLMLQPDDPEREMLEDTMRHIRNESGMY